MPYSRWDMDNITSLSPCPSLFPPSTSPYLTSYIPPLFSLISLPYQSPKANMPSRGKLFFLLLVFSLLMQTALTQFQTSAIVTTTDENDSIITKIPDTPDDSDDPDDLDTGVSPVTPFPAGPVTVRPTFSPEDHSSY